MRLNLENGETWENPSSSQIEEALRKLEQTSNSFLILERDSEGYMQAAGDGENGFYLEYRSASSEKQYRCADSSLSFEASAEILKGYATKNRRWRTTQEWEQIKVGSSEGIMGRFLSPSLMLLIAGIFGAWAIYTFEAQVERLLNVEITIEGGFILTTIGIGLGTPHSIQELRRWDEIGWYMRTNSIMLILLFLIMLWGSTHLLLE